MTEDLTKLGDAEVIDRVLNGDKEAFRFLVERYSALFYSCAYNLCHHYDTAADLVQEALISAYQCLDRLNDPSSFAGWVAAIIRNKYRNLGRKKTVSTIPLETLKEKGFEPPDSDVKVPYSDEDLKLVMKYVHSLPEKYREIIMLKYVEDYSYKEIATFLKVPMTTVATRLVYARRILIKMAKEGGLL